MNFQEILPELLPLAMLWGGLVAWILLQIYALIRFSGWRRIVSAVPIVGMVPILWLTYEGYRQNSNLWPILLIFTSPCAALWVLGCVLALYEPRRTPSPSGDISG